MMTHQDKLDRFEELEAGRVLGDLDAEESSEWEVLSKELNSGPSLSLELAAAAVETEFVAKGDRLPDSLAKLIQNDFPKTSPSAEDANIIRPSFWNNLSSPNMGWIAAALMAALFMGSLMMRPNSPVAGKPKLSVDEAREYLIAQANDLIESDFSGIEAYGEMAGKVVWSDERQEGYMTLTNLPANDPAKKQYQLWIVDPGRDEKPVDGGVFDIPSGDSTAIIPIRNPLAVNKPGAFVITLEQPGGVVVSKQEIVVALAKRL